MSILRTKDKDGNWIDISTIIGPIGPTPQIKIGTVVEVPYGSEPKVTLEGTPEEPVINFEIPEGKPGDQELPEVDFTNMFKIINIGSLKSLPSNGGAVVIVSEADNIADKISPILAEGKLPVLYSVTYQGLFFPTFTIGELETLSQLTFVLHGNLQKATISNPPRIGTVKLWLQGSYSEGVWNFDPNKNNANIMWAESINVLATNNTYAYVPTMPYHPATKDYVDTAIANMEAEGGNSNQVYFVSDNSSTNPLILSQCKAGVYIFPNINIYLRPTEESSSSNWKTLDGSCYVIKEYDDAEIGDVCAVIVSETGSSLRYTKSENGYTFSSGVPRSGNVLRTGTSASISAKHSYSVLPESSQVPTGDKQFTNKKYVDDAVANAAPTVDTTTFLNYKGHVASVEDLPSTGQASGTATAEVATMSSDYTSGTGPATPITGYDYFIRAGYTSYEELGYVATNFPEVIDWANIGYYGNFTFAVHVNASTDKPVQVGGAYSGVAGIAVRSDATGVTTAVANGTLVTEPSIINLTHLYGTDGYIEGNIPQALKYSPYPENKYYYRHQYTSLGTDSNTLTGYTSLNTVFNDGYVYTDGMQMLTFDPETYKANWVLNESMATPNEVYTVGDNYDIYHCDDTPKWTPWSQGSSSVEDLPTFAVKGNSNENPIVWSNCKKGVYVFEDRTVYYKMDDDDSIRQVSVSDYKIYKLYDGIGPEEGKPHFIFFGKDGIYAYKKHTLYDGGYVSTILMPSEQSVAWTIQGSTTFNYAPKTYKTPSSDYDLTNKKYVDGLLSGIPSGSKITKGETTDNPIIIDELSVGTHFLSTQNNLVYAKDSASTSAGYANLTIGPKLLIVIKKFSDVVQDEVCALFITPELGTGYITKASTASGLGVAVHLTNTDFLTEVKSAWITGNWGFEYAVECSETPTSGTHLTNKSYVDTGLAGKQNKVTYGTGDPSGGSDGDVYFKYTA